MKARYFHVDVFSDRPFGGNPAIVCVIDAWPDDATLLAVAREHNKYTAFVLPAGQEYPLRWFVPAGELELCGHATIATTQVLLNELKLARDSIRFATKGGVLTGSTADGGVSVRLPAEHGTESAWADDVTGALGLQPQAVIAGLDALALLPSADAVRALRPDLAKVAALPARGVMATAASDDADADYVLRFFAPGAGIPEDPATASAQCLAAPFWAARLGKTRLAVRQLSARGGAMTCAVDDGTVEIAGAATVFQSGTVHLPIAEAAA